jgi:hypothetical protein
MHHTPRNQPSFPSTNIERLVPQSGRQANCRTHAHYRLYAVTVFVLPLSYLGVVYWDNKTINPVSKLPFCDMDIHVTWKPCISLSTMTTIGYGVLFWWLLDAALAGSGASVLCTDL